MSYREQLSNLKVFLAKSVEENELLEATLEEERAHSKAAIAQLESDFKRYRDQKEELVRNLELKIQTLENAAPIVSTASRSPTHSSLVLGQNSYFSDTREESLTVRALQVELEDAKASNALLQERYAKLYEYANRGKG